jgi:flagellar motility protein MotE (MotC chaperone)
MKRKGLVFVLLVLLGLQGIQVQGGPAAFGQEDPGKSADQKRQELLEKEGRLKKEEERLKTIEKEVEAKIQKLNQLLVQVEEGLKKIEEVRSGRLDHLVKVFEAMPPEEAAQKLTTMKKSVAIHILFKMNTKKAGAIMAFMEPKKVADITEEVTKSEKKIPTK